jgi:lipopolysaccharide transport system permease protein
LSDQIFTQKLKHTPLNDNSSTGIRSRSQQRTAFWLLLMALVKRDIKVVYAQTRFGILWTAAKVIISAILIHFLFGFLLNIETGIRYYIMFAFPGMLAWYFFSFIVNSSATSLIQSQNIILNFAFPKLVLPFSKALPGLIDVFVGLTIYIIAMPLLGHAISSSLILLPVAILLNLITGLGIALWLSILTIRFRDANHIIPYIIGFGIFVTPVFYPNGMLPDMYRHLLFLNPMSGVVGLYRLALLNLPFSSFELIGLAISLFIFISGIYFFRKYEPEIADVI